MTRQMTATELKAKILRVLDDVATGEEVEITKHGRTIARLIPASGIRLAPGKYAGVAISTSNDEELFSAGDRWEAE